MNVVSSSGDVLHTHHHSHPLNVSVGGSEEEIDAGISPDEDGRTRRYALSHPCLFFIFSILFSMSLAYLSLHSLPLLPPLSHSFRGILIAKDLLVSSILIFFFFIFFIPSFDVPSRDYLLTLPPPSPSLYHVRCILIAVETSTSSFYLLFWYFRATTTQRTTRPPCISRGISVSI